jgi:hypothetical protein
MIPLEWPEAFRRLVEGGASVVQLRALIQQAAARWDRRPDLRDSDFDSAFDALTTADWLEAEIIELFEPMSAHDARVLRERLASYRLGTGARRGPARGRRRGRPPWTEAFFDTRLRDAIDTLGYEGTDRELARHFRARDGHLGVEPATLARLRRQRSAGRMRPE